jgi:hypothetical protein
MLPNFSDITSRIAEPPTWFDTQGTPRYGEFRPEALGIYDDFAVLVEIECQSCGQSFCIGCGGTTIDTRAVAYGGQIVKRTLEELAAHFAFGDPPRHDAAYGHGAERCAGETMSCNEIGVVQAWRRVDHEWVRDGIVEQTYGDYDTVGDSPIPADAGGGV